MTFAGDKKNLVYINDNGSIVLLKENSGQLNETILWESPYSKSLNNPDGAIKNEGDNRKAELVTIYRDSVFAYLGNGEFGALFAPFNMKFNILPQIFKRKDQNIRKLAISPTSFCILTEAGAIFYKIKNGTFSSLDMEGLVDVQAIKENYLFLTESGSVFEYYGGDPKNPSSHPTFSITPSIIGGRVVSMNCSSDKILLFLDNGNIQLYVQNYTDSFMFVEEEQCFMHIKSTENIDFRATRNLIYFKSSANRTISDLFNFFRTGHSKNSYSSPLLMFFDESLKTLHHVPMPLQLLNLYDIYYQNTSLEDYGEREGEENKMLKIPSPQKTAQLPDSSQVVKEMVYDQQGSPHLYTFDYQLQSQEINPRGADDLGFLCGDQIQLSENLSSHYGPIISTSNSACVVLGTRIKVDSNDSEETQSDKTTKQYEVCLGLLDSIGSVYYSMQSDNRYLMDDCNHSTGINTVIVSMTKKDALLKWRLLWRYQALLKDIQINDKYIIQVDTSIKAFQDIIFKPGDIVIHKKHGKGTVQGIRSGCLWVQFQSRAYSFRLETATDHLEIFQRKNKQMAIITTTQHKEECIELATICDKVDNENGNIPIRKINSFAPTDKIISVVKSSAYILVGSSNKELFYQAPLSIEYYENEEGKYEFRHLISNFSFDDTWMVRSPDFHISTISRTSDFVTRVNIASNSHPNFLPGDLVVSPEGNYYTYTGKYYSSSYTGKGEEVPDNYLFHKEDQVDPERFTEERCSSFQLTAAFLHKYYITAIDVNNNQTVKLSIDCSLYFDSDDINSNSVFSKICKLLDRQKSLKQSKTFKVFLPSDTVLYKGEIRHIVGFDENGDYYLTCGKEKITKDKILVEKFDDNENEFTDILFRHVFISSSVTLKLYSDSFIDIDSDSESSSSCTYSSYSEDEFQYEHQEEDSQEKEQQTITFSNSVTNTKCFGCLPLQKVGNNIILGVMPNMSLILTKNLTDRKCFVLPHLNFPIQRPTESLI